MPLDCGTLSAPELMEAINSAGLGAPLTEKLLKNHREAAPAKRFNHRRVYSLPAYVGWLHDEREKSRPKSNAEQYEIHKQKMADRSREKSLAARDIGEIPKPLHVEEAAACRLNLALFCKTFLPGWFPKAWSPQHLQVIREIENIILNGGMQAIAMPRGRGKTTITKAACLWAVLYGHRKYVLWLAAEDEKAGAAINDFWKTLRRSEKIVAAFPAACYPLVRGGSDQRSRPLYQGRELDMGRRELQIILPDIEGSPAASNVLEAGGLLGSVRGPQYQRSDGTIARPDCVILDDPQTDQSAKSTQPGGQCDTREKVINGAVLGLGGPGVKMAAVMPCTIIRENDLSSRILNRKLNPDWHGITGKMLETLPLNMPLWEKYNAKRIESLNEENSIRLATDFYLVHRQELDRGAIPTWDEDFEPGEASAVQHAMNLYFRDRPSFFAERQNAPLLAWDSVEQLNREDILQRYNLLPRFIVPDDTSVITAFVDVHKDILYWMVVAWRQNFSGQITAYGTWPDQRSAQFDQRNADFKIGALPEFKSKSLETQLEMAFLALYPQLDREWQTESGEIMRLSMSLIDANWEKSTAVVHKFAATSAWRGKIFGSHGRGISAAQKPISAWKRANRDVFGPPDNASWTIPADRGDHPWRHVVFDANVWKTHVAEFLMADPDGAASLALHAPEQQYDHRLLADHFTSEHREPKIGPYRTADSWSLPDTRPDNHWLDCLTGAAVAASIRGIRIPQLGAAKAVKVKKKARTKVHYGQWE